jgi:cellulose synthase/poly-beta-1,6-N-acetylglucosamine synthase-like glycosyltransferase
MREGAVTAPGSAAAPLPFVSVIVPCRNEAAFLGPCLDSILASDYPPDRMEILVADGMSRDGTRELIERYVRADRRVRTLDNPARITPAGLNRGIAAARGEIILRLDAHAAVASGYIRRAVRYLTVSDADNVGGVLRTLPRTSGVWAQAIAIAIAHPFGVGPSRFRIGAGGPRWVDTVFGGCWRKDVFRRVGQFNERLERGQDLEFNLRLRRAGGKILLAPDLEVRYYARATITDFWRHNWTNGVWAIVPFAYTRGAPVRWRHLAPLAFGLVLAAAAVLSPRIGAGAALAYLTLNLAASFHAAAVRRRPQAAMVLPAAFASLHLAYGAGSAWGLVRLAWIFAARFLAGRPHSLQGGRAMKEAA